MSDTKESQSPGPVSQKATSTGIEPIKATKISIEATTPGSTEALLSEKGTAMSDGTIQFDLKRPGN